MERIPTTSRRRRAALAGALAVVTLAAALPAAHAAPAISGRPPAPATVPPDFPADVPLPPGAIQSSTGAGSQWGVLLLVPGSAADALSSTEAFYRAHGFAPHSAGVLQKGNRRITIVVENRDHSPTETFLVIGVQTVAPPPGRVVLHSTLTGAPGARGTATVTIDGARVCWRFRGVHGVRPSSAAIRQVMTGHDGPVMIPLGSRYRASGCTTVAVGRSIAARPTSFYVDIATRSRPLGAIRGRLRS